MEKALEILKGLSYDCDSEENRLIAEHIVTPKKVKEAIAELQEAMNKTCEWKLSNYDYNLWVGKCGAEWTLIDGTPTENKMNFCPQCGGKLIDIQPKEK